MPTLDYRDGDDDRRDRRPLFRGLGIAWVFFAALTFTAMVLIGTGLLPDDAALVVVGLFLAALLAPLVYLVASGVLRSPRE